MNDGNYVSNDEDNVKRLMWQDRYCVRDLTDMVINMDYIKLWWFLENIGDIVIERVGRIERHVLKWTPCSMVNLWQEINVSTRAYEKLWTLSNIGFEWMVRAIHHRAMVALFKEFQEHDIGWVLSRMLIQVQVQVCSVGARVTRSGVKIFYPSTSPWMCYRRNSGRRNTLPYLRETIRAEWYAIITWPIRLPWFNAFEL